MYGVLRYRGSSKWNRRKSDQDYIGNFNKRQVTSSGQQIVWNNVTKELVMLSDCYVASIGSDNDISMLKTITVQDFTEEDSMKQKSIVSSKL